MKINYGDGNGSSKGFTLVELLIVMAIIAVLVGITIAGLGFAMRRSRNIARMSAMTNLDRAISSYYSDNLEYIANTTSVAAMIDDGEPLYQYLEGSWEAPAGTVMYYKADASRVYYVFCVNQEQTGTTDDTYSCTGSGIGQATFPTDTNEVDCEGVEGLCGTAANCDADGCS